MANTTFFGNPLLKKKIQIRNILGWVKMLLAKEESSSSDQWVRMFWTRIKRSQDHLVSLQWLTILTGQGHISELIIYPKT